MGLSQYAYDIGMHPALPSTPHLYVHSSLIPSLSDAQSPRPVQKSIIEKHGQKLSLLSCDPAVCCVLDPSSLFNDW